MSLDKVRADFIAATNQLRDAIAKTADNVSAVLATSKREIERLGGRYDALSEQLVDAIWRADPKGHGGNGHFYELSALNQGALNALEETARPSVDDLDAVADAVRELKQLLRSWEKKTAVHLRRIAEAGR